MKVVTKIARAHREPTLTSVASGATPLAEATSNDLTALLAESAALQSTLTAALLRRRRAEHQAEKARRADSKWITVEEACERSALTPRWFYRRADRAPYNWIRRLSNRTIRIEAGALEEFLHAKRKRD